MDMAPEPRRPAWSRPEVVFIVAALTLLIAFLVPVPAIFLAVLWVVTFCLAGAVTLICVAAGSSSDLIGFVPLVSALTLLRLVALAGSSRRIIQHEPADPLLQSTGIFLSGGWPLGAVLICLLLAAVISIVVFAASQKIALASARYTQRILPLKRVGIETDLRMGVINSDQAKLLSRRIVTEFRFFAGMQGTSLLMKGETAICVMILLACVLLSVLGKDAQPALSTDFLTQTVPSVTGLAVFAMLPLAVVAASCARMMSCDTLALRSEHQSPDTPAAKTIRIITKETGAAEEIEILNPESLNSSADQQFVDFEPTAAPAQMDDRSQPAFHQELEALQNRSETAASTPKPIDFSCRSAEEYYEKLSRTILADIPVPKNVVLAAKSLQHLPVTVAVNVAIRLAQKQKTILLVDTDTTRNPLARVFDLDPQTLSKKAVGTCFERLFVCTVPAAKLRALLRHAEASRKFDLLLIYAPDCTDLKLEPPAELGGFFFGDSGFDTHLPAGTKLRQVPPIHSVFSAAR